jgi:hypothetical protein
VMEYMEHGKSSDSTLFFSHSARWLRTHRKGFDLFQ